VKIALLGDVAFFGKYCLKNNPKIYDYFSELKEYLSQYDLIVANLEAPFVEQENSIASGHKSAYVSSDPININLLKFLGINVVNLANNHILDYGVEGFNRTVQILEQNEINWFGVNSKSLKLELSEKIAFHGYCAFNTNPLGAKKISGVNPLIGEMVEKNLKESTEDGFYNILSIHSGIEHVNYPSREDINLARYFSTIAPYTYYGHHPHVSQGVEKINDSVLAYSLGNLCFDDVYDPKGNLIVKQSDNNKASFILTLDIIDGKVFKYDVIDFFNHQDKCVLLSAEMSGKVAEYSAALSMNVDEYEKMRNSKVTGVFKVRNSRRDLKWLLNRLRYSTLVRLFELNLNKKSQRKFVSDYLKNK
jgi:poly-gamma-glutamate synthesis protein (capsule biosynthesis protein)